jgi:hypothetical protein
LRILRILRTLRNTHRINDQVRATQTGVPRALPPARERISPALEHVDSSSGAIGAAVNHAIADLVPIIAGAPADAKTRDAWLDRLWEAHAADGIPYIEALAAVRLERGRIEMGGQPVRHHSYGSQPQQEVPRRFPRNVGVPERALPCAARPSSIFCTPNRAAARGRPTVPSTGSARRYFSRPGSGRTYATYGLHANRGPTYLATFRAVARKYPHKTAPEILADLVKTTPGQEGKWFAAAKEAGLYEEALALAGRTPTDPKTLTRAARDLAREQPAFALEAGLLALHWLVKG